MGQCLPTAAGLLDSITKKGKLILRTGESTIRDDGERVQVSKKPSQDEIKSALTLAITRFGSVLKIEGSEKFKSEVIKTAIENDMPLRFSNTELERKRLELLYETERKQQQQRHSLRLSH